MRQKKKPVRRRVENDSEATTEVLGRFQLRTSQSLDFMLANEIATDIKRGSESEGDVGARDEERRPSRRQALVEEDEIEDSAAVRGMPPTLAAIERQIAAQQRQQRSKTQQKKKQVKKRKRPVKHVSFDEKKFEIIPPPELIIDNGRFEEGSDESTRVLHIAPRKVLKEPMDGGDRAVLWSFRLDRTRIDIVENERITAEKSALAHFIVVSGIAIRDVWQHYALPKEILDPLMSCVKAGWIELVLCTSTTSLHLVLTQHSFEGCKYLPFIQQQRQHKKYEIANCLQSIMKLLFRISKAAPIFTKDKSIDTITAKDVYNLVDNKNLERYENDDKKQRLTLNISGLLPTLRPYQAAAVQWMLKREHMTTHGDEWKVIWNVLNSTTKRLIPLIELKESEGKCVSNLYYCPFNGRIARTIQEAKQISLGEHTYPVKGGILADQMGLGKTIEVLSCILANPFPQLESEDNAINGVVKREDSTEAMDDNKNTQVIETAMVASACPTEKPVEPIEERWFDNMEVGSCICGGVIKFARRKQKSKLVFCDYCEEPMHLECTCLKPPDLKVMPKVNLRRRFGHETLECVRCDSCPCCAMKKMPSRIRSRATIIICPPAIMGQWAQEIKKHTNQMKVLIYGGVEKESKRGRRHPDSMKLLHPEYLADVDIILVSFVGLMSDLSHSEENRFISKNGDDGWSSTNLRRRKKYRIVPSPLLSIHFWRVCIDEAQRVETTTTKAAKMALKLNADHFWAVSGTPIGHGNLQDLYGLFLFLRLAPFDHKDWFSSCMSPTIEGFDERIQALLRDVFWRSTKSCESVKRQIGIPEMKEERVVLNFSSIERHFYNRQLQKTLQLADDCNDTPNGRGKRKSSQLNFLSESLHRLRAACCHPQVGSSGLTGGRHKKSRKLTPGQKKEANSLASRVMTMEQILDRFITDARHKCEEAQRIAILHTNGMAAITRLKTEAKARGVKVDQSDRSLLVKSGELYREALSLARQNASPVRASAEAVLSGDAAFYSPNPTFRDGKCSPMWKMNEESGDFWATIEYEDSSRRISKILARPILYIPKGAQDDDSNLELKLVRPTSVKLQVATAATGGEFVDCVEASLQNDWIEIDNSARVKKSKAWRLVVTNIDYSTLQSETSLEKFGYFMGLEIQLYEPQINSDDLQLLHSLHNACLSYKAAIQIPSEESNSSIQSQVSSMEKEIIQIESLHKEQAQILHQACKLKLDELTTRRNEKEQQLYSITYLSKNRKEVNDCWDDGWYDDFLGLVCLSASEAQKYAIFERIVQDVEGLHIADEAMKFPEFNSLHGLRAALQMRISKIRSDGLGKKQLTLPATTADNEFVQIRSARFKCGRGEHGSCIQKIHDLSPNPGHLEIDENRHCRLCKADWNQTGKICGHCNISGVLQDLKPDSVTIAVLTAIYASIRTSAGMALLTSSQTLHVRTRAEHFFEVIEAEDREKIGAWRMWKVHLDLLNGLDELDSCKRGLRLSMENEDLTLYTEEQLNAIVQPIDIYSQYHDHAAKQAMSLGDLRQSKGTLRYLQNQKQSLNNQEEFKTETCVVCLQPLLDEDCCVLRCGHRFHHKPCFDQILKMSNARTVCCPMKCRVHTARNEVMISTKKSSNDGSNAKRAVKGSYGTKITRIVSDILGIKDKGEKGIIFSQWHDMLDILESALVENNIRIARPSGGTRFNESLLAFHSPECTVLLLNLKQGAEGLTLVHASHVFMVEPVMNNGLDQQAINRVHRIGQTRRTTVWRYLIKDTIEMKIDEMRRKQGDNETLEDSMHSNKLNSVFSAGGMDGGFATQAELLEILDGGNN